MATNDTTHGSGTEMDIAISNITSNQLYNHEEEEENPAKIAVVVMLCIFSVVGVIGNAIAFYIFFDRRSTSTSVIFILALAGTDFFTCLVTIPYTIVFELLNYYLVYDMACKTYMFLITSTVPFSAYIMVGIALDRYFCICHPFLFVFTLARAKAVIFCMAIPAVVFGLITALSHGTYVYQSDIPSKPSVSPSESDDFIHNITVDQNGQNVGNFPSGTNIIMNSSEARRIVHYGHCVNNTFIFSQEFLEVYKKIHALNFLVAYISVAVLYILIYKSIFTRRANKARRRKENNMYVSGGSKSRDNQQEETQMTFVNGGDSNSPQAVNKQTRKDGKCARKITMTARNDPSSFNKAESHRASSNPTATSEEKEEERMNLLDENPDVWSNETNGNSSNVSTCNTNSTPGGMLTENEDPEEEDGCSVYIGPQTYVKKTSPNQSLTSSEERNKALEIGNVNNSVQRKHVNKMLENVTNSDNSKRQASDDVPTDTAKPPTGSAPEEKPLLPRSVVTPATPPNSLALKSNVSTLVTTQANEKQFSAGGGRQPIAKHGQSDSQGNSLKRKRQGTVKDKNLIANMKTAFMLFIVTLVFLIAFLPALLMANGLVSLNLIVFYGFFIYNVANPFIYAFMNQTFREDLKKLMSVCRRRSS